MQKKNITFILGISIPILMILLVAISIYLPAFFIQPHFNFLYVSEERLDYSTDYRVKYFVQNGKVVMKREPVEKQNMQLPSLASKLYIYDVVKNESKEISFEAAQNLNLDPRKQSPDGFEIIYGSHNGIFPFVDFAARDSRTRYLKKGSMSKKLSLRLDTDLYYADPFHFLGWIK